MVQGTRDSPDDQASSASGDSIAAIIVTFSPNADSFSALLTALSRQVDLCIVVDNTPCSDDSVWKIIMESEIDLEKLRSVRLGDNFGIGSALNIGADIALESGASFVLLSDQDSLPAQTMVASLYGLYRRLSSEGNKVGAVGPTYTDIYTGRLHPFQTWEPGAFFYGHRFPDKGGHVKVLSLITSGTLIERSVLEDVGPMDEGLFIDYVDVEWCLRAASLGYDLFGSGAARMSQRMGDKSLRVWYLGWRSETYYPPLRLYYRVRNHIALTRRSYVPMRWKIRASWYITGVIYSHTVFGDKRLQSLRMTVKGLMHGISKRMGKLSEESP